MADRSHRIRIDGLIIQTQRLTLRPWQLDDVDEALTIFGTDDVPAGWHPVSTGSLTPPRCGTDSVGGCLRWSRRSVTGLLLIMTVIRWSVQGRSSHCRRRTATS